jgi:hypothetical protein
MVGERSGDGCLETQAVGGTVEAVHAFEDEALDVNADLRRGWWRAHR